jgi:nucleotidyltransferase/DNA polymerase involved in DNA repair
LDEAFLDVTENFMGMPSATLIAQEIKKKIYKRTDKLTASAGVSFYYWTYKEITLAGKGKGGHHDRRHISKTGKAFG